MDEVFDKSEQQVEEDLPSKFKKLKGFWYDSGTQNLIIRVSNFTNLCASLKIIVPMLLAPTLVLLILALTRTIVWFAFFFVLGILGFTFLTATLALLFNRNALKYVVSKTAIIRSVGGMTWVADYDNIREVKPRRSLFFKNGGSISFKLYNGSGVNLQFYLLKGWKETCELINAYKLAYKAQKDFDSEFDRLFSNDDFEDLLDFVNHDSSQIDKLPNCLKVYYVMWMLYDDQSESGFDEFFINNREITDKQLLQACRLLDLHELTELCKRAVALNEKYDIANNDDLPEECSEELSILDDEFAELDSAYNLEDMFKKYYIDNYEKFDFE